MSKMQKLMQLISDNKDRERGIRSETIDGGECTLWIYDVIDKWWGVSAEAVGEALESFSGADVAVRINSPGGDVFEGRAIQTLLKQYSGKVTIMIDGVAASAASTVALGGNKRVIADGAFFMIHNSMTVVWGNKEEMRETADFLEKIDGAIGKDYAVATGESREQIETWMNEETWFDAEEAKQHGFVDEIFTDDTEDEATNRSTWNLSAYGNTPKSLAEKPKLELRSPVRDRMSCYIDMVELNA